MMKEIYNNNIISLRSRYPELVQYLEDQEDDEVILPDERNLSVEIRMINKKPVLYAQKGDSQFCMDSIYDGHALLEIWFRSLGNEWDFGTKLLMYGLGSGAYAKYYLDNARKDCSLIVHEPSVKIFRSSLANYDLTRLFEDPRFRLVFWPLYNKKDDIGYFYNDEVFDYKDISSQKTCFYPNYPRIFTEDVNEFINGIVTARGYVVGDQVVHDRFGEDFNRNSFSNMMQLVDSLSLEDLINEMPKDIPAIVVAAGPSLDKNINDIRAAKGKCLIISTDTALKPLALAGIKPDLAAIMDGKKDERYMSEESSRKIPLICTIRSGDAFMKLHKGPKFFIDADCNHISSFMKDEGIPFMRLYMGGSVANLCFTIAKSLHCKRIIFVGQDLAYTGDRTHSKVTVRGEKNTAVEDLEHPIMGIDINGDPIRTSLEFNVYREWFEHEIKADPDITVIDATEGGVRIDGTILMTLKDAIKKECKGDFNFKEVLEKVGKLIPKEKEKKYLEYIEKTPGQIEELKTYIRKALADYANMRKLVKNDRYNTSQFMKLYRNTTELSEKIENSPVIEYVHNQLKGRTSEMLDTVNKLEKDEKTELLSVCDVGEKYLNDMLESVNELKKYVDVLKTDLGIGEL